MPGRCVTVNGEVKWPLGLNQGNGLAASRASLTHSMVLTGRNDPFKATMPDLSSSGGLDRAQRLSQALGLGVESARVWQESELEAIFRHQMAAPVVVELGGLDSVLAKRVRLLATAQGLLLKSFRDVFRHPSPPLELLLLIKDFAKANRGHFDAVLPNEIASVLYYASIAAALVRCRERITKLTDQELLRGFGWAMKQSWLEAEMRQLLAEAKQVVRSGHKP